MAILTRTSLLALALAAASTASAFVLPAPAARSGSLASAAARIGSKQSSSSPLSSGSLRLPGTAVSAAPSFFDFLPKMGGPAPQAKGPGGKKLVVVTGTSSGLGRTTLKALAEREDYYVVCGVRDPEKMQRVADELNLSPDTYTIKYVDLGSFDSVRRFAKEVKAVKGGRPLDALVCNAAVYLPVAKEPTFTADGHEISVATNHLGHFLLSNLLLEDLQQAAKLPNSPGGSRCIIVGSITGNTNTLAGNVPPKADLGDLSGLTRGASMIDGGEFDGAKAYKDSKVCNMLTVREMHRRLHDSTGVTFSTLYPGCIAETGLFRNHVGLFRTLFPAFQKYVTKGYVSEEEAGKRLAQVVSDSKMSKSGVYWSWSNETGSFENQVSEEVSDEGKGAKLWEISEKLVGL